MTESTVAESAPQLATQVASAEAHREQRRGHSTTMLVAISFFVAIVASILTSATTITVFQWAAQAGTQLPEIRRLLHASISMLLPDTLHSYAARYGSHLAFARCEVIRLTTIHLLLDCTYQILKWLPCIPRCALQIMARAK